MKKVIFSLLMLIPVLCFNSCSKDNKPKKYEEMVVVANRGSSSISFIDANTNLVTANLSIDGSEPMYVVYVPAKDKLYVGDRAGKKVHVVDPQTKMTEDEIAVGNGVFHMWADGKGKQLWVNNDVDNTISVINLNTNTVVQTIDIGMKPHDIFLTQDATKAYISIINPETSVSDKVFMYSTASYTKTGEVAVGKDPHLFHLPGSNRLFVPCQSGQVYVLNGNNLNIISNNPYAGAHGIFASPDQNNIFITNISGGELYSINASTNLQNGSAIPSSGAVPHNITVNAAGDKMFVTHSGPSATTVSTYTINASATLSAGNTITVGTNPFGLAYYKRKVK